MAPDSPDFRGYLFPRLLEAAENGGTLLQPEAMFRKDGSAAEIRFPHKGASPSLLLDFGVKTAGYLFLETVSATKDLLRLEFGPTPDSLILTKTLRLPDDGRFFMDREFIALRYARLSFVSDSEMPVAPRIRIRMLGLRTSALPVAWLGDFRSDDPEMDRIWQVGAYTNQVCLQPMKLQSSSFANLPGDRQRHIREYGSPHSKYVIVDGPRRDREAWLGDIRAQALTLYTAFGLSDVVKASLELFADLQRPDGSVPGSGATWQEFREYNLWWIISVWEHYLFTGERDFLVRMVPGVRNMLDWIRFQQDEDGLMWNNASWLWTLPRECVGSAFQCILKKALECAGAIEREMGNEIEAQRLDEEAGRVAARVRERFWDEARGVFLDDLNIEGEPIPILSDANAYAVVCGVATPEQAARICDFLPRHHWTPHGSATMDKRITTGFLRNDYHGHLSRVRHSEDPQQEFLDGIWPHNRQIWPFINAYEVEAHFLAGRPDLAYELVHRCWGGMLRKGATTFWEMVDAETGAFDPRSHQKHARFDSMTSASHGWSGWVSFLLQAYGLGIRPLAPGYRRFTVDPCPGPLRRMAGRVSTPAGIIVLALELGETPAGQPEARIDLSAPEGLEPVPTLAALRRAGVSRIVLNGKEVTP